MHTKNLRITRVLICHMGFLGLGKPLSFEESKAVIPYIREHGIIQFLKIYDAVKTNRNDSFLWGDEIEYIIIKKDEMGQFKLFICFDELIEKVTKDTEDTSSSFHPEYAGYMIEATPNTPYGSFISDLFEVERNMNRRRKTVLKHLPPDCKILSLVNFPYMGVGDFTIPSYPPHGPIAESDTVPDEIINSHPRFATLTRNIKSRRGEKVNINMPLFPDINTVDVEKGIPMDCMGFGMGCCCLQVTFQARDLNESLKLHDQLTVIAPLMLSLTAASPIWHGKLANVDTRWNVISQSCDDRTRGERGVGPLSLGEKVIPKSRYSSIDLYISNSPQNKAEYNDIEVPIDEKSYKTLIEAGIHTRLAKHIAHLFVRDPLVVFEDRIYVDDDESSEHFESFQSTNWQSVRWKPPPPKGPVSGWRVELRTMEVQLTDCENAAFTIFAALLARTILFFDLNLYIPISKVDINMERAHNVNSVVKEKFWFRRNVVPLREVCSCCTPTTAEDEEYGEYTLREIFKGHHHTPGLITLIYAYLDIIGCKEEHLLVIKSYISVIVNRITGKTLPLAGWIRKFVTEHPDYKHDSIIPPTVFNELTDTLMCMSEGKACCECILSANYSGEIPTDKEETQKLLGVRMRGASFHEEISCSCCKEIAEIIEQRKSDFSGTEFDA